MAGNSLSAALDGLADPEPATPPKRSAKPAKKKQEEGTVLVGAHFPPAIARQLKIIAAEEGTTNKALIQEALNLLFKKKGVKPIL